MLSKNTCARTRTYGASPLPSHREQSTFSLLCLLTFCFALCCFPSLPPPVSIRLTEKADRATSEQVLDPRTRMILFKMLTRGVISEINGCISTGKEVRTDTTQ